MKYLSFVSISTVIFFLTSCGDNSSGETIYIPKDDSNRIITTPIDTSGTTLSNINSSPNSPTFLPPVLNTQQPVQPTAVAAGMNPEHGKPGHRCDIAVGAPLNSAASQQPAGATSITPTITNTSDISAKNATIVTSSKPAAAGMNPEHGKPGHRCDIAVGAPLNSSPATVQPTTQPSTSKSSDIPVPIAPSTTPSTTPSSALPGTTNPIAAGMNPEHGKPGHRCDIAVGAPLPKQ